MFCELNGRFLVTLRTRHRKIGSTSLNPHVPETHEAEKFNARSFRLHPCSRIDRNSFGDFTHTMNPTTDNADCESLIGECLRSVEKKDYTWFFDCADDIAISTESPWRFMSAKGIIVTSEDHGHQFGRPAPVDAAERVFARVAGQAVVAASIIRPTGDLSIEFDQRCRLEFLQMPCGYESWRLSIRGSEIICTGGGDIAYFRPPIA